MTFKSQLKAFEDKKPKSSSTAGMQLETWMDIGQNIILRGTIVFLIFIIILIFYI